MNNKELQKHKYFVTGGAGFIGSHLVDFLLEQGLVVTVYDNLSTGNKKNIEHCFEKKNFNFIQGDILDFEKMKQAMSGHSFVWHLAANTDIRKGNQETDWDLKNCTVGTRNVLEAMKQLEIKNLIFASSSTIYGDKGEKPMIESNGPLMPICLYGAGKLAGEGLISAYSYLFDIKACIFRFGNVVGNRMEHGVILDFINKLKNNSKELEILGNGKQKKNFFLVEDCIQGMSSVFFKNKSQCDVFNLGNASFTTVTGVADIICKEMGLKKVKYRYTGGKGGWKGDVPVVKYNISKAKKLGFRPKYNSNQTVKVAAQRLIKENTI